MNIISDIVKIVLKRFFNTELASRDLLLDAFIGLVIHLENLSQQVTREREMSHCWTQEDTNSQELERLRNEY